MTTRINLQPAFILHTRFFSDSSLLVDVLTLEHGRLTLLAKGVRASRSRLRGILLPFIPLLLSWSGKTDLPILTKAETTKLGYNLQGKAFLSGFYLNELITRLLQRHEPHERTFIAYENALLALQNKTDTELVLRKFEKELLADLGFGLELDRDVNNNIVEAEDFYIFEFGSRLVKLLHNDNITVNVFSGKSLLALHHDALQSLEEFRDAKRLLRMALANLLGNKPLKSREMFQSI